MVNINTSEDLLELLRENQELREAVRQLILSEELLRLPVVFHVFMSESRDYSEATDKRLQTMEEGQGELKEGQRHHTNEIGQLNLEIRLYRRGLSLAAAEFKARDVYRIKVAERDVNSADFNDAIYEALENDVLSEAEYDRVLDTDMIISGDRPNSPNPVYVAIEASYSVSRNDIAKVSLTAGILGKIFQDAEIHAALYYMEIADAIQEEAVRRGIHLIKSRSLLN